MTLIDEILTDLKSLESEKNRAGMARFGIQVEHAYGVSVANIRRLAKPYRHNHELALELWKTGIHEARILAAIIDDPKQVTPEQMDRWVQNFNSWDLCDQTCSLFDKTPHAVAKIKEWTTREKEFEKRAGFALLAELAWHSKTEPDQTFLDLLPLIEREAHDDRNYVKKAANWALREIGKRSMRLHAEAIKLAQRLQTHDSKSARWIASDALRELTAEKTLSRINK
ncbi:MAG TPA: DNA alkylation repair protein [Patescibacteria group bacterium]